jgi:hypothetical protein
MRGNGKSWEYFEAYMLKREGMCCVARLILGKPSRRFVQSGMERDAQYGLSLVAWRVFSTRL